tara:strand:+ start:125 stop:1015 length:891 start_codon:yes stop_codon:yes gene_type:complete
MKPAEILKRAPKILTEAQRRTYFEDGFVLLPGLIDDAWLKRLRQVSARFVEQSRSFSQSDGKFDLEDSHTAESPKLRRLSLPVDHDETFREFAFKGPVVDVAEDLLGPDVCYHHSKLNYKWSHGGEEVKWHQDIHYWPHTDFSPLTIGVYLEDVDDDMGPMGIVPVSHTGKLYSLADENGNWTGAIRNDEIDSANIETAVYLKGPAGSITVHNCCSVHGSAPNLSTRVRPLLLQTYTAGDSIPLQTIGTNGLGQYANTMVRGSRPDYLEIAGRQVPTAPDYSGGYTSIFAVQQDGS